MLARFTARLVSFARFAARLVIKMLAQLALGLLAAGFLTFFLVCLKTELASVRY